MENTYYNKRLLDEDANLHLERLADQTGELEKRIKQLEISPQDSSSINTLQTNVDSLQSSVNTNTNSISTLQGAVNAHTSSISDLQTDVDANTTSISTLQGTVNTHTSSISDLQTDVDANTTSISTLQGAVNTHTSSINNLTSTVNSFQSAINQNTQNISTSNQSVSQLQSTVNGFQSAINQNTQNITTNTNGITNLTTSVNSCLQAVSDINNGAELPTPLFTIAGHSFGTPVYSVYDEYEYCFYHRINNKTNLSPIYFINTAYSKIKIKIEITFETTNDNTNKYIIILFNGEQISKRNIGITIQEIRIERFELDLFCIKQYNNIEFYIEDAPNSFYHKSSKFILHGKNVQFLNNKQNMFIVLHSDNSYILTKTVDSYPYIQNCTRESFDSEFGWQALNGVANIKGNNHCYFYYYTTNANNEVEIRYSYITYNNCQSISTQLLNINTNYNKLFINNKFFQSFNQHLLINYPCTNSWSFSLPEKVFSGSYTSKISVVSHVNPFTEYTIYEEYNPGIIVDTNSLNVCCFSEKHSHPVYLLVNEKAEVLLVAYLGGPIAFYNLGFGTQPSGYYLSENSRNCVIFVNRFGNIFRIELSFDTASKTYSKVSEEYFYSADKIIKGISNDYHILINNQWKIVEL